MKGTLHTTPPPGLIFAAQAAKALGMTSQNFHKKYARCFDRWQVGSGPGTLLFRKEDVAEMVHWRRVRQGMIALGHWPPNTPGVPSDGDFHTAVHEGYWDQICPMCGGEAVGDPLDERVWCEECGIEKTVTDGKLRPYNE